MSAVALDVKNHIVNHAQEGAIPLLHWNVWDITYLDGMINGIKRKGHKIVTVTEALQ